MKVSYNWLKSYLDVNLSADEVATILTSIGLEVESIEHFESIKGGLKGMVVGEVLSKEPHPDADRLSLTKVSIGGDQLLSIVCGASNVEKGQKVVVATIGATLYPTTGNAFEIKKSKIRGQLSEGMICAEDEIGLGSGHDGILVLDSKWEVGTPAAEVFGVEQDAVFEIGLTPNRADAASHVGVARDLMTYLNYQSAIHDTAAHQLILPSVNGLTTSTATSKIAVEVIATASCLRYSGLFIKGVSVQPSPAWLQNRLKSIGLKPINNIVDAGNFVMHELGQPLHLFDAEKIEGNKIIVKHPEHAEKFIALDGTEQTITPDDLMICDSKNMLCIAGVFGGLNSGIQNNTKDIFIESACFDAATVRKTSKRLGLKTDASFRFERGTDPEITLYALKRAAALILDIAGGHCDSAPVDIISKKIEPTRVGFSFKNCAALCGAEIDKKIIKNILTSLGIEIISEGTDALMLSVPAFKVDVKREVDVIEEVLRIYGYNNIAIGDTVNSTLAYSDSSNEALQLLVANLLSNVGFNEILTNSLTTAGYYSKDSAQEESLIRLLNPLSSDLNVLRADIIYSGLEAILYNLNRKNNHLQFYEFGNTYTLNDSKQFIESKHLALFITGKTEIEQWNSAHTPATLFTINGVVELITKRLGLTGLVAEVTTHANLDECLRLMHGKKAIVVFGKVKRQLLKNFDIKQDVYFADFNWQEIPSIIKKKKTRYTEISKFPAVSRDLALLLDKHVSFDQLENVAKQTERKILKEVQLVDVYEGDKIASDKKSYALRFTLLDEQETLTDKRIDQTMEKLLKNISEKTGAVLR